MMTEVLRLTVCEKYSPNFLSFKMLCDDISCTNWLLYVAQLEVIGMWKQEMMNTTT